MYGWNKEDQIISGSYTEIYIFDHVHMNWIRDLEDEHLLFEIEDIDMAGNEDHDICANDSDAESDDEYDSDQIFDPVYLAFKSRSNIPCTSFPIWKGDKDIVTGFLFDMKFIHLDQDGFTFLS
jgi:hypothetical protein